MIEITHVDYSFFKNGGVVLEQETENKIYMLNNSLYVTCKTFETDEYQYTGDISFELTKKFIQELKALVMVMENTFEEVDDDSRD